MLVKRNQMQVGDLLTFKSATRSSYVKATRKIRGFDEMGRPMVGYQGWDNFIVMPREIITIERPD